MADWNDWGDDDDQLDFGTPVSTTNPPPRQNPIVAKPVVTAKPASTFASGWDDDETLAFDAPAPTPQRPAVVAPVRVNPTRAEPRAATIPTRAPQTQRVVPTAADELFADVAPPSATSKHPSAPVAVAKRATPALVPQSLPSGTPVASLDGWGDDFSVSPAKPAPTASKPLDVGASRVFAAQSAPIQPNGTHDTAPKPQTTPSSTIPQKMPSSQQTTSTVPVTTTHPSQNAPSSTSTPKPVAHQTQTQTQPPRPAQFDPTKTPLKAAPTTTAHAKTPAITTTTPAPTEPKTPIAVNRTFKPTSSIKLPSMPTRTPQPNKTPSAATPAQSAPQTSSAPNGTASTTQHVVSKPSTTPTIPPQASTTSSTIPVVPKSSSAELQPIVKSTSSKRLTEDGKPIPLTRTRPAVLDSPLAATPPSAVGTATKPTQTPSAPVIATQQYATEVSATTRSDFAPSVVKPSKIKPSFSDWESEKEVPSPAPTPAVPAPASTVEKTISSADAAPAAIPASTVPSSTISDTNEKEKLIAPVIPASKTAEALDWDANDWGSDDGSTLSPPASEPSLGPEPTTTTTIAVVETTPNGAAPTDDFGWGDDDNEDEPFSASDATVIQQTPALEKVETSVTANPIASGQNPAPTPPKPVVNLDSLKPKPTAVVATTPASLIPQPAKVAPTSPASISSTAKEGVAKPAASKQAIAFVPPVLSSAEPPKPASHLPPGVARPGAPPHHYHQDGHPSIPKPTTSVPAPRVSAPTISTFTPSVQSSGPSLASPDSSAAALAPASNPTAAPPAGIPPPRSARPKAVAPKLQPQIAAPFSSSSQEQGSQSTPSHAHHTHSRSKVTSGPIPLEEMRKSRAVATFGFGGSLILVFPRASSYSSSGAQPAGAVTLSSISKVLEKHPETVAMRSFPGPAITKSSKELTNFLNARCKHADQALHSNVLRGEASRLLWHLLRLLIASKGVVNGPKGCEKEMLDLLSATPPNPDVLLGLPPVLAADCTEEPPITLEKRQELTLKIQALVQQGKREEALSVAVSERLWDHALLLAAWISPSVHRDTVSAFVVSTMPVGSPLRTTYLQLAGKYQDFFKLSPSASMLNPASSVLAPFTPHMHGASNSGISAPQTSFGAQKPSSAANPHQGLIDNWKANLASVLANKPVMPQIAQGANTKPGATSGPDQALVHLGDALWTHASSVEAAHLCYLLADYRMDGQMDPGSRLALVGGDHKRHSRTVLHNVEALHMSELLEFSKRQSTSGFQFPGLQPYKLAYASTLIDLGLLKPALDYLESIKLLVGENKSKESIYTPTFLNKLGELHTRLKAMIDGKPISTISASSATSNGASSQKSSWFGSIVHAAFDKIMGDDEEVPKQGQLLSSSTGVPPGVAMSQSGNMLVPTGPGGAPGKPFTPPPNGGLPGQAPLSMSGSGGIPSLGASAPLAGPKGPMMQPPAMNTPPVNNFPPITVGFTSGGPPLPGLTKIPLPKIGAQPPHHHTTGPSAPAPVKSNTGVPQPTGFGPTGPHSTAPTGSQMPGPNGALQAFPLPTIRASTPKAKVGPPKPTAAVAPPATTASPLAATTPGTVPAPTAIAKAPVVPPVSSAPAAESTPSDDEAELFDDWGELPATPSKATTVETPPAIADATVNGDSTTSAKPAKTAEELADEAELFDGEFDVSTPATKSVLDTEPAKESSPVAQAEDFTKKDEIPSEIPATGVPFTPTEPAAPTATTGEDAATNVSVKEEPKPTSPVLAGAILPPPKRNGVTAPGRKKTPSVVGFKPSGSASPVSPGSPKSRVAVPTPTLQEPTTAAPTQSSPDLEEDDDDNTATSNVAAPQSAASASNASTLPPPKKKKNESNREEATPESPERTPTPPVPTGATPTSTPSTPAPGSNSEESFKPSTPPAPGPTPNKRPSLLPPKKTPASKPAAALLAAPEGLPPLDEVTKKPFKPAVTPSALPPSTTQQKRAERMGRSISASAVPRPDALATTTANGNVDDEAASDDEKAQEKVLKDARAQIAAEDSVVAPVSALPPISMTGPPSKKSTADKEPKDKSSRRPVPKRVEAPTSSAFVPPSQPPSLTTPAFTPTKEPSVDQETDDTLDETPATFKTPQATKSKQSTAPTAEAPKTEPKKARFGWLNPRNWFTPKKTDPNEPTPTKAKLGGTLKDGPLYRHPELGWVERGKEEEKRREMAAAAAPPTKSTKKKPKPETAQDPGLVTPQPARGPFNRTSQATSDAPDLQSTPTGSTNATAPGSSRSGRGRRYVGASGDVIETGSKSAPPVGLLAMPPMTPVGAGKMSVFTPMAPSASVETEVEPSPASSDPVEPIAVVRQPKKPKSSKSADPKKKKSKKSKEDGGDGEDSDDSTDLINAQPLTLSASFPITQSDDEEDADDAKPRMPRKTLAERKAEAAAAAAAKGTTTSATPTVAASSPLNTSGGKPKFGSPRFGFQPSSGDGSSSSLVVSSSSSSSSSPPGGSNGNPASTDASQQKSKKTKEPRSSVAPAVPAPEPTESETAPTPTETDAEESPSPAAAVELPPLAAPTPTAPSNLVSLGALPTISGLPPPGGARAKAGVRAPRPKSAAARFQPMASPSPNPQ